jgi:hypothetical protein
LRASIASRSLIASLSFFQPHDLEWVGKALALFGAKRFVDAPVQLVKPESTPFHTLSPHVQPT